MANNALVSINPAPLPPPVVCEACNFGPLFDECRRNEFRLDLEFGSRLSWGAKELCTESREVVLAEEEELPEDIELDEEEVVDEGKAPPLWLTELIR